jgi:hypothetical protein
MINKTFCVINDKISKQLEINNVNTPFNQILMTHLEKPKELRRRAPELDAFA